MTDIDATTPELAGDSTGTPWWNLRSSVAVPAITALVVGVVMWAVMSWQNSAEIVEPAPSTEVTTTTPQTVPEETVPETTVADDEEPVTTDAETPATTVPESEDDGLFAAASLDDCAAIVDFDDTALQLSSGAATTATFDSLESEGVGAPAWSATLPETLGSAAIGAAPTIIGLMGVGDDTTADVVIPVGLDRTVIGRYDTTTAELLWGATVAGVGVGRSDGVVWFATLEEAAEVGDAATTLVVGVSNDDGSIVACYRSIGAGVPLTNDEEPPRIVPAIGTVADSRNGLWVLDDGIAEHLGVDGTSQVAGGDNADGTTTVQLVASADGVVVATVFDGNETELVGYESASGETAWQQPFRDVFASLPMNASLSGQGTGSAVVLSGALSDAQGRWQPETVAVEAATGEILWSNTDVGAQVSRRIVVTGDDIQLINNVFELVSVASADGATGEVVGANAGLFVAAAADRAVAYDLATASVIGGDELLATTNGAPLGTSGAHLLVVVGADDGTVSLLALPYDNPSTSIDDSEGAPDT